MTSLWQYAFVQHALIAGAITAIVAGCVAPFVTLRNMGFGVHGLADVPYFKNDQALAFWAILGLQLGSARSADRG